MAVQLELVSHQPPFPEVAEQAPAHEIASAALQQNQQPKQQKQQQKEQQMLVMPHNTHQTQSRNWRQVQLRI